MTSYQLSQQHNLQTVLWTTGGTIYQAAMTTGNAYRTVYSYLPGLLFVLGIAAKVLGLVAVIVGIVAAVACIPPVLWLGLALTGAFGWVTYPRSKVVHR